MKIGYARVSTQDQSLDAQIDALTAAGCERIYQEKISGKDAKSRPELQKMLATLREGDEVVVFKLDRLGRSTQDLISMVSEFEKMGVGFVSITEKIDTGGAMGRLIFQIFAALAEFERNVISERTKAGLAAARARGRSGGRKAALSQKQKSQVVAMYDAEVMAVGEIAENFNVSRQTIYNVLKEQKQ